MAITGIDTIEGKQIIAAGAVSAKSAERAYNDENGNPITGYLTAVPESSLSGYIPYSAYGISLINSNFSIDINGQAYKSSAGQPDQQINVTYSVGNMYLNDNNDGLALQAGKYEFRVTLSGVNSLKITTALGTEVIEVVNGIGVWNLATDYTTRFWSDSVIPYESNDGTGTRLYFYSSADATLWYVTSEVTNKPYALIDDISGKQDISGMTAYQPAGAYLTTGDSANFYTTANESGFISEVPAGTMNESAFGYDANDKISGYNGSAFAGGSDVPEGVMVESGLEYNAINQISGYNGSAIAQYGHEAQWLVHDDTLVHASNSAQYALGVNISAIQQLMGIDETVLFESANAVTNAPLSESMTAFNRVRVSLANDFTDTGLYQTVIDLDVEHGSHVWEPVGGLGITNMWVGVNMLSANTDYTILTAPKAKLINFGNWTTQGTGIVGSTTGANVKVILKVIGIGRKQ